MFSILVSLLQLACDEVIGSDTMKNARKSLIVAQILYLSITVIGCIWITVVYSIHSVEDPESPKIYGIEKTQVAINKFKYSRFYLSKLMVVILASVIRVSFHPVLIPFTMDIKHMYKLLGSIMFTVFEFVGRLMSFQVDEYIDPNKKSPNIDHDTFLVLLDVPKYLLFVMQLSACGVALYSTWKQRLGISKNPVIICLLALSSGFIVGFTSNCAFEGAQSSLEYYSHLKGRRNPRVRGEDSNPPGNIITADVAMDTSNANDILTLFNYVSYVAGSIISYVAYKIIKAHKESPWFIIKSRGDSLDVHAVNSLAQKLKLA